MIGENIGGGVNFYYLRHSLIEEFSYHRCYLTFEKRILSPNSTFRQEPSFGLGADIATALLRNVIGKNNNKNIFKKILNFLFN